MRSHVCTSREGIKIVESQVPAFQVVGEISLCVRCARRAEPPPLLFWTLN